MLRVFSFSEVFPWEPANRRLTCLPLHLDAPPAAAAAAAPVRTGGTSSRGGDASALSLNSRHFALERIRRPRPTSVGSRHPLKPQSLTQRIMRLVIFQSALLLTVMRRHVPMPISCGMHNISAVAAPRLLLSGFPHFPAHMWQLTASH